MDSSKLSSLIAALDLGSISAAAGSLGYTPSGVSKAISALEAEVGFALVERSKEGVRPTIECSMMLPLIRELVATMDKLEQTASAIKGAEIGTLNIGSSYNIYYRWLTEKIAEFFVNKPGIKVRTSNNVSSELKKALDNYQMDACIMSRREGNFEWIHLKWDQLVVLVPRDHKYVERGTFPVRALESEPYIDIYPGSETDNSIMLEKYKITPNVRFVCADGGAAVPIVEAGLGVCIVNELIADGLRGNIVALPLYPQQLVDIGIAIPTRRATSPIINKFIDYLVEKAAEIC